MALSSIRGTFSSTYALRLVGLFGLYFAAGRLGLSAPFTSGNVSPFWPASGIALAGVVVWGYSVWPGIAAAAFLVNFWSPIPAISAVGIAIGNTGAALVGGFLLRRYAKLDANLGRLSNVIAMLTLGAFVSPIVAASIGTTTLSLTHVKAWSGFYAAFRVWWLGDGMGILIATPLFFAIRDLKAMFPKNRIGEAVGLLVGTAVAALMIFSHQLSQFIRDDVLAFAVFPFVIWAAIRFQLVGASIVCFLTAGIAVWGTAHGDGPFVRHDPAHNAALMQLFLAVLSISGLTLAAVIVERTKAESALRNLSGRLLNIQDAERRRLARELHDSSGQHLVVLQMNLSALSKASLHNDSNGARLLTECQEILSRVVKEIRTLSCLLYPPLLDEAGLPSALRWYINGLVDRTQLNIELQISPNFERLSAELETTLFRVVQECLTNIHRHSGSAVARIHLDCMGDQIRLTIRDEGRGINPELLSDPEQNAAGFGVGIRGMVERVRELGGTLRITRAMPGTLIDVVVPMRRRQSAHIKEEAAEQSQKSN